MELEAEVQKLKELNQELERKQVGVFQFSLTTATAGVRCATVVHLP